MKKIVIDANIILNVWRMETDPSTGLRLYEASASLLESILNEDVAGVLLTTTAMEILHCVRVNAEMTRKSADFAIKTAERDISRLGLQLIIPDAGIMGLAYDLFRDLHLDPYDAILVAAAVSEKADALISRDTKLKKKTARLLPVVTPENFSV